MRRRSRECAMQILYQLQLTGALEGSSVADDVLNDAIASYWDGFESKTAVDKDFAELLVRGVVREIRQIDEAIETASTRWKSHRMGKVDRNLARVAAFEILHCPDVPRAVAINEVLEIAKRFGGEASVSFLNGLVDRIGERGKDK